jgi:hypothetical protein
VKILRHRQGIVGVVLPKVPRAVFHPTEEGMLVTLIDEEARELAVQLNTLFAIENRGAHSSARERHKSKGDKSTPTD